jgi:uncharacterized protein YoaH (UPF0181 family)
MTDDDGGMTPLREAAGQLHEMYLELKRAGFSRGEALELVAKTLASGFSEAQAQQTEDDG